MKLLLLLLLVSCNQEVWKPSVVQQAYVDSLPLAGKAYFESCLSKHTDLLNYCMEKYSKLGKEENKSGPSTADIAVGTAVGVGAATLLFGK